MINSPIEQKLQFSVCKTTWRFAIPSLLSCVLKPTFTKICIRISLCKTSLLSITYFIRKKLHQWTHNKHACSHRNVVVRGYFWWKNVNAKLPRVPPRQNCSMWWWCPYFCPRKHRLQSNARRRESFLATVRKIPWQSRKELHLHLATSCGVNHGLPPWFSMHFKSIATFLAKSATEKIRSVDEKWHMRNANSASITSPSHRSSSGGVWVPACNVWLPQGPSYSMKALGHNGKWRLYKPRNCHQVLTSSRTVQQRQSDDLRQCWMFLCPTDAKVQFGSTLDGTVEDLQVHNNIMLIGDLNVNTLDNSDSNFSHSQQFCLNLQLRNLVQAPTRKTPTSSRCLDVILTSVYYLTAGIVEHVEFSDHAMVLATIQNVCMYHMQSSQLGLKNFNKIGTVYVQNHSPQHWNLLWVIYHLLDSTTCDKNGVQSFGML